MGTSLNLNRLLYRDSAFFFVFFLASAVLAFWPGYLSVIFDDPDIHHHVHGALMRLWLFMLIGQAYLIRSNHRALHRQVGKLSYILGPAVVISIVVIAHHGAGLNEFDSRNLVMRALQLINGAPLFALAYGLAMYFRNDSEAHARFMLCTPLAMVGPIFNRILGGYVGSLLPLFEDGDPFPAYVTLPTIDLLLFGVSVWDWKAHRRMIFPIILVANVLTRTAAYLVYDTQAWGSFMERFVRLPLS